MLYFLFSLHVVFSGVHKFLLDDCSCILECNFCVVLCELSVVQELLSNISKLIWCKFLVVHLARSTLKAIWKVSIVCMVLVIGLINAFFSGSSIAASIHCNVVEVVGLEFSPGMHNFSVVDGNLNFILSVGVSKICCCFLLICNLHLFISLFPLSPSWCFLLHLGVVPWNCWELDCPSEDTWGCQCDECDDFHLIRYFL